GNMIQANAASDVALDVFNVPTWMTGTVMAVLVGLVILGGVKSIGRTSGILVQFMVAFYLVAGIALLIIHIDQVTAALRRICSDAFTGQTAGGGALGTVVRMGVARGLVSNEAGLGTGGIAAASARTDNPAHQALVSMTQVYIDTIVVCSITG